MTAATCHSPTWESVSMAAATAPGDEQYEQERADEFGHHLVKQFQIQFLGVTAPRRWLRGAAKKRPSICRGASDLRSVVCVAGS